MFTVRTSTSVASAAQDRTTFADAVFFALNQMKEIPSAEVSIVDHVRKHRWNAQAIIDVAPTLAADSASHMGK